MNKIIYLTVIFVLLVSTTSRAQNLRIPYRVGDKFGLSNEDGELIVDAVYDEINFMEEAFQYFQYTNIIEDSIRTVYDTLEPVEKFSTGVIHNDQVILKDKPYKSFRIYKQHFIVGSMYNDQRPEDCMLYNLKGDELIDSEMQSIYFNYDGDVGQLRFANPKRILISFFHPDKSRNYKFSLASYDTEKQEISEWLLKEVSDYRFVDDVTDKNAIIFEYQTDGKTIKELLYFDSASKKFKRGPLGMNLPDFYSTPDESNRKYNAKESSSLFDKDDFYLTLEERYERLKPASDHAEKWIQFTFYRNDRSLYYDEKAVIEIPNARYIKISDLNNQAQPVIYQVNSKYGLILNDTKYTEAKFDSLLYIRIDSPTYDKYGFLYMVGKQNEQDESWKFGIMNQAEEILVPIQYDLLLPFIPTLTWDYYLNHYSNPMNYATIIDKRNSYSRNSLTFYSPTMDGFLTEKDGRFGIISLDFEVTFPFEYDGFYHSEMNYTHPVESQGDFMVVQRDGMFAMVKNLSIPLEKLNEKFLFPFLPSSYYTNYGGKADFHLIRLVTRDGTFCYAREDGFVYYKEK